MYTAVRFSAQSERRAIATAPEAPCQLPCCAAAVRAISRGGGATSAHSLATFAAFFMALRFMAVFMAAAFMAFFMAFMAIAFFMAAAFFMAIAFFMAAMAASGGAGAVRERRSTNCGA